MKIPRFRATISELRDSFGMISCCAPIIRAPMGRHLSQLMNLNRYDGSEYNPTLSTAESRPNALYSGFNYRANNLNSNYNSMVTEVQKRFSKGLQFQFSFTWSRLMDQGSDLFSGSTTTGGYSQPFYFLSNNKPGNWSMVRERLTTRRTSRPSSPTSCRSSRISKGSSDAFWAAGSFPASTRATPAIPSKCTTAAARYKGNALDPNGFSENIGGDYNLDGVANDHPDFIGTQRQRRLLP